MEEVWKDIKGYEGLYQVSDLGRVKSLYNGKERVKCGKNVRGYLVVGLCKDGKQKDCKIHRVVAEAFIPNPDNLPEVNHKDECKTNNAVNNLEWCSRQYNVNYGTGHERSTKAQINHPSTSKTVYQYSLKGVLVKSYPSLHEAGRRTGYSQGSISDCCNRKRKSSYGYIWSYTPINPINKVYNLF